VGYNFCIVLQTASFFLCNSLPKPGRFWIRRRHVVTLKCVVINDLWFYMIFRSVDILHRKITAAVGEGDVTPASCAYKKVFTDIAFAHVFVFGWSVLLIFEPDTLLLDLSAYLWCV
jgi:hypothetical protein